MAASVSGSSAAADDGTSARFFGFEPASFVGDIYNCIYDYLGDGFDDFEVAMRKELGSEVDGHLDDDTESELVRGCDDLVGKLGRAFDINMDIFEHYVLRNLLHVPEGIEDASGSTIAANDGPVTGPTCTRDELEAIQQRTEELQQQLVAARKRRRALQAAKRLCEKRLPKLREAGNSLTAAAAAVTNSAAEASGPARTAAAAITDVVSQARRLDELCDSLARASGQESRRRSTLSGAAAAAGSALPTFGDVRAAFDADLAAGTGADVAAAKAAADALA